MIPCIELGKLTCSLLRAGGLPVVLGLESLAVAGDGVGESVTQVDAGVAEPDSRHGRGEVHVSSSL